MWESLEELEKAHSTKIIFSGALLNKCNLDILVFSPQPL